MPTVETAEYRRYYCETLKGIFQPLKDEIKELFPQSEFREDCKATYEEDLRTFLAPTKFKTPPGLIIHCEETGCKGALRVSTSPAKLKKIESWCRENKLFCTRGVSFVSGYPEVIGENTIEIEFYGKNMEEMKAKAGEIVGKFKLNFDK